MKYKQIILIVIAVVLTGLLASLKPQNSSGKRKKPTLLHAGTALRDWYASRSFPGTTISVDEITSGFQSMRSNQQRTALFTGTWQAIGPKNFGGRTLCLCFNPLNPNTIYAGSASGGLWRTYSSGSGANAWHQVATGFPVLGIGAIAINPADSNEIYIGTGEVYNDQNAGTGFAVRTTRGTYGIGILKSVDGGITWAKSLDWQYNELKGIQDIIINPLRPASVLATTTEGTFRSYDSGLNWTLIEPTRMGTDLLMMPNDTSMIFVAAGNSFSANSGIYRSVNGGNSFTKITNGLPVTYSGKAMLTVGNNIGAIVYASIGDQLTGLGLFASNNSGVSWYQVNPTDYQTYQGWYSHDVIVKPSDEYTVLTCGINVWKSDDGGVNLTQKSLWSQWDFNATTVGGSEGPPDYVHADIHKMYFHPLNDNIIYMATDGGIFRSYDCGETFEGCNGSYQTQQFYANFSSSTTDSLFAIGGMQDNATAVYEGNDGWRRVIGGDGISTAIDPADDNIVYGSSQYLNVQKSDDKAQNFNWLSIPGTGSAPYTNFAGPFVLCPSDPAILYAGRDVVYKSDDYGWTWYDTNGGSVLDFNPVLVLEVSETNPDLVYAATAPITVPQTGLFKTINGGISWTNVTAGIPNRYIMDVKINPGNNNIVFVCLSGFGTPHLYKSADGGNTWSAFGNGLPDVPVNTITIDPLNTAIMYLGNDIGIYVSIDAGQNWQPFSDGLIDGTFVMDIGISQLNRKLRLATHGKGVYERNMLPVTVTSVDETAQAMQMIVGPNPALSGITIQLINFTGKTRLIVYDTQGKKVKEIQEAGANYYIDLENFATGKYFISSENNNRRMVRQFVKL